MRIRRQILSIALVAFASQVIVTQAMAQSAKPTIVISFGYPQTPRNPESRTPEEWSERANRKPLDVVVRRV